MLNCKNSTLNAPSRTIFERKTKNYSGDGNTAPLQTFPHWKKIAPRMHQISQVSSSKIKKLSGEGDTAHSPDPFPIGEETTPSQTQTPQRPRSGPLTSCFIIRPLVVWTSLVDTSQHVERLQTQTHGIDLIGIQNGNSAWESLTVIAELRLEYIRNVWMYCKPLSSSKYVNICLTVKNVKSYKTL